ncbi:MAG: type II toxin-antitoxin system RelE/ParE family toxin [Candidatus Thioglobus sp.]|uniref:type II toxin-antitoxin system RelE family toxin n=1 Tax=Candidatus Thioglobus sp. TaxID=2026721 RepID=UPI002613B496|nr:type II toxin-antitoxin system RelE/ParE family toxin [Candidatus Thioglobus sp.]MDC9727645.1 type II toxin-antitoxin system RelE/ParE family toxin [Candidatus Thioglobus sp.]
MAKYRLVFKKSVAKDLKKIPNKDIARILERINTLVGDPKPQGAIKLTNQEKYRIRQGTYRILYELKDLDLIITVVKIAHRKEVYKNH